MRSLLKVALVVLVLYAILLGGVFWTMCQPPDTFGRIVARAPQLLFAVVPFEPLWRVARAGGLEVGDPAPDFALETPDRSARVQLSSHRGQQPVVLVFGSYT
jgi:hypothetical protein